MNDKKGYLKEDNGMKSSMRLIFIVGSLWSMAFTTMLALSGMDSGILIAVFGSMQGTYIAMKLGQKPMEQKTPKPPEDEK